jgi:hypothetical protein
MNIVHHHLTTSFNCSRKLVGGQVNRKCITKLEEKNLIRQLIKNLVYYYWLNATKRCGQVNILTTPRALVILLKIRPITT